MNWLIGIWAVTVSIMTLMDFWCLYLDDIRVQTKFRTRLFGSIFDLITAVILWLCVLR